MHFETTYISQFFLFIFAFACLWRSALAGDGWGRVSAASCARRCAALPDGSRLLRPKWRSFLRGFVYVDYIYIYTLSHTLIHMYHIYTPTPIYSHIHIELVFCRVKYTRKVPTNASICTDVLYGCVPINAECVTMLPETETPFFCTS